MTDFVHCNQCFALPDPNGTKFWFTSCTHIFCSSCCESIKKDRFCSKCKSRCEFVPLDKTIRPELRSYFEPIERLLQKLVKIERFQRAQRGNLLAHFTSQASRGQITQEKWEKRVSSLKKEIHSLRSKIGCSDPLKRSNYPNDYNFSRPPEIFRPNRHQVPSSSMLKSQSHENYSFNQPTRLDPVTPMINEFFQEILSPII
ncbi:RING finger protein 212B-like isoform X3 [Panonychus citri]|uniref:RING finger protein 212B-like isoform X3 n=1 Tax=Panonychus citri TaxID=50023 RepID=UPI00230717C1|nr:RING finger protein 212B-like isoform X3 [Panonychus citri]